MFSTLEKFLVLSKRHANWNCSMNVSTVVTLTGARLLNLWKVDTSSPKVDSILDRKLPNMSLKSTSDPLSGTPRCLRIGEQKFLGERPEDEATTWSMNWVYPPSKATQSRGCILDPMSICTNMVPSLKSLQGTDSDTNRIMPLMSVHTWVL